MGGFRQEPRFGEHCYRHNAQCSKKPLLRLRQPESVAAAETVEKRSTKMQSFTEAEEANLELSGAQRLSWAAFGWSRALESTATGTMLSARRSRFFASASGESGRC
ncbi:unnamed protein product [Coccothraustes coccothraustes]